MPTNSKGSHQESKDCKPAKVTDISLSKTGKHGGMKHHITGQFLDSQKNAQMLVSSGDNVLIPDSVSNSYQVLEVKEKKDGGTSADFQILDDNANELTYTFTVADALFDEIKEALDGDGEVSINVLAIMGSAAVTGFSVNKD